MKIAAVRPLSGHKLEIRYDGNSVGTFDVTPYLQYEAFAPLKDKIEFRKITNGGYFVEWDCGADLSADTIEAGMKTKAGVIASD